MASAALLPAPCPAGDTPAPRRPLITGLSHVALWVANLDRSRAFYKGYLGFDEPYTLPTKDGGVLLACIKINDRQSLELFPISEATPRNGDSLYHVAFETDNAQGMLDYLVSRGVKGPGGRPLPGGWETSTISPRTRTATSSNSYSTYRAGGPRPTRADSSRLPASRKG